MAGTGRGGMSAAGELLEGWRNNGLTSYAGSLRARGFDAAEILEALREMNQQQCDPPLPDSEVRNIAKSAARWKPYHTWRGGEWPIERAVYIPRGCFDPRPAVCGFDPAAIVQTDTSLGLWHNHKALYAFLAGLFGPWGCHPSQRTVAEALGMQRQHVARHAARLVRAGLILLERGDYSKHQRKFAAQSYHFRRHWLFSEHFTRQGLPVFNEMEGFWHHCDDEEFSTGQNKIVTPINQGVTEILARFSGAVVPITQRGGVLSESVAGEKKESVAQKKNRAALLKRKRAEIPPWDFESAGAFRACLGSDKGQIVHYSTIALYLECAARCGGARVVYSDGTVKQCECSCGVESVVEVAA